MQSWALKRIHDHVAIEACVAKSLVRTEQRTVSALLGARSSIQVHHVVKAALQRNGYVELAKKVAGDLEKKKADDAREGRDASSTSQSPERSPSHPSMPSTHPLPAQQPTEVAQQIPPQQAQQFDITATLITLGNMITSQQAAIAMLAQQMADMHQGEVVVLRQLGDRIEQTNAKIEKLLEGQLIPQQPTPQHSPTEEADGSDVKSQPTTPRCLESPAHTVDLTTPRPEPPASIEQSDLTAEAHEQPNALRPFKAG